MLEVVLMVMTKPSRLDQTGGGIAGHFEVAALRAGQTPALG